MKLIQYITGASVLLATLFTTLPYAAETPTSRIIEINEDIFTEFQYAHPNSSQILGTVYNTLELKNMNIVLIPADLIEPLSQHIHNQFHHCGGFTDITESKYTYQDINHSNISYRYPPLNAKDPAIVKMISSVNPQNIKNYTINYSKKFTTRLASSKTGIDAPRYLASLWRDMVSSYGRDTIQIELIATPKGYQQSNVRVSIPGTNPSLPKVILGGHLDSINQSYFGDKSAPGADDNASGIGTITEVLRVILDSDYHPQATVELIGYAAEELGLYGSAAVAESYYDSSTDVRAVMQLDMVGFSGSDSRVTFYTDHTNASLTEWTENLYSLYLEKPYYTDKCGYACSDHASWTRYNYPSVFPFESKFDDYNHKIHSSQDVWDGVLNEIFASDFAKLAVAYIVELSK